MATNSKTTAPDIDAARRTILGGVIWFCLQNKLVVFLLVIAIMTWGVIVAPFDWSVGNLPRDPVPARCESTRPSPT